MKKFLTALLLCVVSATAVAKSDDCVTSPYDGKIYCCNMNEKNLPDGAINMPWGEEILWDKYYGTARRCVGGRLTNDHWSEEFEKISPNLSTRLPEMAIKHKVAHYRAFSGSHYWDTYDCDCGNAEGLNIDGRMGCYWDDVAITDAKVYICRRPSCNGQVGYLEEILGKDVEIVSEGYIITTYSAEAYFVRSCKDGAWTRTRFCSAADFVNGVDLENLIDNGYELVEAGTGRVLRKDIDEWGWWNGNNYSACWRLKSDSAKYNYKSCSTDADCTGIDNKKSPYLHSTAWKCIEQTAGVRVCAAQECETGWTPINGYCQEDKNTQTPQSENKNAVPGGKAGTTKTCPDSNMDSNCECTRVAETVKSGDKCVCIDKNKKIENGKCEYTAAYRSKLKTDIDSKYSKIKSLTASFEVNKWKDAEGNFNTARLASDSIAGVVLGTAGGIITSKLVKKNQLKKGFEDIQCHIGGQSVADYGDEFTVGR